MVILVEVTQSLCVDSAFLCITVKGVTTRTCLNAIYCVVGDLGGGFFKHTQGRKAFFSSRTQAQKMM